MFTDEAQQIIDKAKDYAFSGGGTELTLTSLLLAVRTNPQISVLLAECLGITIETLREKLPNAPDPISCPGKLPLDLAVRTLLSHAQQLAEEMLDPFHPGLIDLRHLACAMGASRETGVLLNVTAASREEAAALLACWQQRQTESPSLSDLTAQIRSMREKLISRIFGQDHAIDAFVEGMFNAEVVASADVERRAPKAIFVFAGPPGVGKTFLAEQGASLLGRPFKRFDMSAYSGHQQSDSLVGMARSYHGAHPGLLTEFVEKNPDAVLLFDEIEKAHTKTIHLFLQILDAGTLEDKYYERNVSFRNTMIIFTTNAGKRLYDRPNESGVHAANAAFHRRTVLDALETEKDPETRQPFFPAAICSRMATGYPVLFNHLGINELERVVRMELTRVMVLIERQYYKPVAFDSELPLILVLREGGHTDARTLRSQAEAFVKTELLRFCQLFEEEHLESALEQVDVIRFALDEEFTRIVPDVTDLFEQREKPRVLFIADADLIDLYRENIEDVEWLHATTPQTALHVLAEEEVDLVLLDLWLSRSTETSTNISTLEHFDHVPMAARGLDLGHEILRSIRERLPRFPVFLLSLSDTAESSVTGQYQPDEELFEACVRGGGARGMLASGFIDGMVEDWQEQRDLFVSRLLDTCRRLHREKAAAKMAQEHKALAFDTVPLIDKDKKEAVIRLRNPRMGRAIAAADAGEVLEEVERPRTRFSDVIGANAAKDELQFFIDYLRNPKRFSALGLRAPKGVLLHGPPGTGKTMLARAMAGETNIAFLPVSATNFVTVWQGSGPQNVRNMFARARRYAPAIIFIDEIDAIGKMRSGGGGAGQAEENTLNALLTEMDGFTSSSPDRPVFLLAATNFKVKAGNQDADGWQARTLDPALVRRFSRTIKVDLPEKAAREEYLMKRLAEHRACTVTEATVRSIAERALGFGIAHLERIIEAAGRKALKADKTLSDEYLEEAFEAEKYGELSLKTPEVARRVAYHEAGHTIMYWLAGWWPAYVTVVSRGDHGGYMCPCEEEINKGLLRTKKEAINEDIRVDLGGHAAEIVKFGEGEGLLGAVGDITKAQKKILNWMKWGVFGVEFATRPPVEKRSEILETELQETKKLLAQNIQYLDAVAEALIKRERLNTEELKEILEKPVKAATKSKAGPSNNRTGEAGKST